MHLKKGHGQGPRSILKPLPEFGTGEARNFKFGVRIDLGKSRLKHDKIPPKRAWSGPGTKNFKLPSVNLERVKLENSNSVHG